MNDDHRILIIKEKRDSVDLKPCGSNVLDGIILPDQCKFDNLCRGTYTTSNGIETKVDIFALLKLMDQIPEVPRIFSMDFNIFSNNILPENTIIMSKDIADALEEVIGGEISK